MEQESGNNPTWEAISALICVVALVVIVAIVQMWPAPAQARDAKIKTDIESLSQAWSKAPGLQNLVRSQSFQKAPANYQNLMIWGWLDQSTPKRFQTLSANSKSVAIKKTQALLAEDRLKGLQASNILSDLP